MMNPLRAALAGRKEPETTIPAGSPPRVKCVVWDLDNTIWNGILLEDDQVEIRDQAVRIISELDARGILHSVASRNDFAPAMAALERFGLQELFLYPRIDWGAKTDSLRAISQALDIGLDSLVFVDDEPAERAEVAFLLPQVRCLDSANMDRLLTMPEAQPAFITAESRGRRRMYRETLRRNQIEQEFAGTREDFLASLKMVFTIAPAEESDLQRAEELTERTHQFNSTGHSFSYSELERYRASEHHALLLGGLEDTFGSYGTVGLVLLECGAEVWTIKLLLMSCRVLSKGIALLMLNHVRTEARRRQVRLQAEIVPNDRNALMSVTYKFAGFTEIHREGGRVVLEDTRAEVAPSPDYINVIIAGTRLGDRAGPPCHVEEVADHDGKTTNA